MYVYIYICIYIGEYIYIYYIYMYIFYTYTFIYIHIFICIYLYIYIYIYIFIYIFINVRTSAEMSLLGHEKRIENAAGVQTNHKQHDLQQVHEGRRRESVGAGRERELYEVARGASVALLHTNVRERTALEDELHSILREKLDIE